MTEKLRIDSIAYRGDGVARAADGRVWFVPGVCEGEEVSAESVVEKKNFVRGRLVALTAPSPDRLEAPQCTLGASPVPGCVYGHARYEAELRWKQAQLLSFLTHNAGAADAAALALPPYASPKRLGYRNKTTLRFSTPRTLGYVADDNESVVDIPQCPLAAPQINEALAEYRSEPAFWRWVAREGGLTLRWTARDGVLARPRLKSGGADAPMLTESAPIIGEALVPAGGFYQVNPGVGAALLEHAAQIAAARRPDSILDFYCGVGVFGLAAAKALDSGADAGHGVEVSGWDTGADVIRAARENARRLGFGGRAKFRTAGAREALAGGARRRGAVELAIVDPPRAGLEPEVARAFAQNPPATLLYVSCAPDTLARDLRIILGGGKCALRSARLFDMFPRTAHFEVCVELAAEHV